MVRPRYGWPGADRSSIASLVTISEKRDVMLGVLLSGLAGKLSDEEARRLLDAAALRLAQTVIQRWAAREENFPRD